MPTLELRFPGGRYHATPWGHHVNEGLIEWPPSPWRLLRALIACGFATQGWKEVPPDAAGLIAKLAAVLPSYRLPQASAAHSRHFMPYIEGAKQKTTLVFDTWADVDGGELVIHWPCELDIDESAMLRSLTAALGYLGRSESWVDARLSDWTVIEFNAVPYAEGEHRVRDWEQVSLMAAVPSNAYLEWREETVAAALPAHPLPEGKRKPTARLLKEREKASAPFPPDLLSCLTKDSTWWKGHGWSQPPGSRRVLYWRRTDALEVGVPSTPRTPAIRPVSTMLLAITTASGNRSALPSVTRTLPQAELCHRAIIARLAEGRRTDCPELTGKDPLDGPLQDGHRHAHTIPVDLDGDARLDHVILYAPMGLRIEAQEAIRSVRRTWMKGGVGELQLAVVGSGDLDVLRRLPARLRAAIDSLLGPPGGARVWESVTPFVPPRFLKLSGKNTLIGQVNAELVSRGLPKAENVVVDEGLTRELRHHVRRRSHGGGSRSGAMGYCLRLSFAEPVGGPLTLGYASHYGLGLFRCSGPES